MRQERLIQPQTIISIVAFIFSLWWVWTALNSRIKKLEEKVHDIDAIDIKTRLAQIQTDIERIKTKLEWK